MRQHEVGALGVSIEAIGPGLAGLCQRICRFADVCRSVTRGVQCAHAERAEACTALGNLIVDRQDIRNGIERVVLGTQQVGEVHLETVACPDAKDDGARPLVGAQNHIAGAQHAAVCFRLQGGSLHHVRTQGIDHAVDVLGAVTVKHERLVEGDHIRFYRPVADRKLRLGFKSQRKCAKRTYS